MIMRIFIPFLAIWLQLACTAPLIEMDKTIMNDKEPNMDVKSNYLALGDSYSIGESVAESDRFPVILSKMLNDRGFDFTDPKIVAKTGWTTDELLSALEIEDIRDTFDLVTLLIGVNNQYRGRPLENYREEFITLLDQAIHFAGNDHEKVIVVSIPDWGVSPFAAGRDRDKIAMEIDLFNAVKKEESLSRGVSFVDITGISRSALNKSNYFAEDGLHFSGEMHTLWVEAIIDQCFD